MAAQIVTPAGEAFEPTPDVFKALAGQETAKRAIEIALTGDHDLSLSPFEGGELRFNRYDIERCQAPQRAVVDAYIARCGGEPYGLKAAELAVKDIREAWRHLGRMAGNCFAPMHGRLHVMVAPLSLCDLLLPPPAESREQVAARITAARQRLAGEHAASTLDYNAGQLAAQFRRHFATMTDDAFAEIVAIGRTIAALDPRSQAGRIERIHLAEAMSYRTTKQVSA